MNAGFVGCAGVSAALAFNAGATQWQAPSSQQGMESGAGAGSSAELMAWPWQSAGSGTADCAHAMGLPRFSSTASRAKIQVTRRNFTAAP